jgi:glycosyltransferase involved in cell wall biosynthesis
MASKTERLPLVSILINNYNYGQFLTEAIDSALNQTYPNIEVIVVDDGSTDNSREIIASYGEKIIPVLKENGGQASAMNSGYAASHGDLICFLDSDDKFNNNKIAVVVDMFNIMVTKNRFIMLYDILEFFDENGRLLGDREPRYLLKHPPNLYKYARKYRFLPFAATSTSGLSMSRQLADIIFPIPEEDGRIAADAFIVYGAGLIGEIYGINKSLALYRVHGKNNYYHPDNIRNLPYEQYITLNNYLNNKLIDRNKRPFISFFDSLYAVKYYYQNQDAKALVILAYKMLKWHTDCRTIKWSINAVLLSFIIFFKKYIIYWIRIR